MDDDDDDVLDVMMDDIDDDEEDDEEEEDDDEEEDVPKKKDDLTFEKRYTVGIIDPKKSEKGNRCYNIFFENNKLATAKAKAKAKFEEEKEKLDVVVWDRDKWSSDAGTEVTRFSSKED